MTETFRLPYKARHLDIAVSNANNKISTKPVGPLCITSGTLKAKTHTSLAVAVLVLVTFLEQR
jgi:hypothetical protein